MTCDSGSRRNGENSRSEVEGEAPQSGGRSPHRPNAVAMSLVSSRREGMTYPVKHRNSLPGYDWPIRWEHERLGDASDEARADHERSQSALSPPSRVVIAIAGGRRG